MSGPVGELVNATCFFLNIDRDYETHFNITSWNYDAVYDWIEDLIQTMNIPFHAEYLSLLNAYPNPFNPLTNIMFSIYYGSYSTISIYEMSTDILIHSQNHIFPQEVIH